MPGDQVMIGFGELRKLSLQWSLDLSAVEKAYGLYWLLVGLFARPSLFPALALRDSTALGVVYFPDYPLPEEVEVTVDPGLGLDRLGHEIRAGAAEAGQRSGVTFKLENLTASLARFEYGGPLGRRSAAQPHLAIRFYHRSLREPPVERPLLLRFSDLPVTPVRAESLADLAAERLALLAGHPRARDLFDLWFIITHAGPELDRAGTHRMLKEPASSLGDDRGFALDPGHAALLERSWDTALKKIPRRPTFGEVRDEIQRFTDQDFFA